MNTPLSSGLIVVRLPQDQTPQAIESILKQQIGLSDEDAAQIVVDSADSQDTFNKWSVLAQATGQEIHLYHASGFRIAAFSPNPEEFRILYH